MSRYRLAACLLAFAASAATADAAVLRVGRGDDPACQFTSLQAAVDYASTHAGPHEIRLSEAHYYGVAVTMVNLQADLRGGFLSCSSELQGGYATLHGNGTQSVLWVKNELDQTQQFERLLIREGGSDGIDGGGIRVGGSMVLQLRQVLVEGNRARSGGGVYVSYLSRLELLEGTHVRFNTAVSGGGLALGNGTTAYLRGPDVAISDNLASSVGGGVDLRSNSRLFVGDLGGTGEGDQGVHVIGNRAGEYGGGINLDGSDRGALLDARDLAVENNTAPNGAGIAARFGAEIRLRRDAADGSKSQCAPQHTCLRLAGNHGALQGAALYLFHSKADVAQTVIADNIGENSIVWADGDGLRMEGVAFHGNRLRWISSYVVDLRTVTAAPWHSELAHLSFVGNIQTENGAAAQPFHAGGGVTLTLAASVFDRTVPAEFLDTGPCNLQSVPATAFFDAAGGDLRPHSTSGLVDRCSAEQVPATYRDPRLQVRCVDAAAPDTGGTCDVGAYELAPPEAASLDIAFDPPTPMAGQNITARVRVEGAATRPGMAAVTVQIDGGESCDSNDGTPQDDRALAFSCTLAFATPGQHEVTASYAGTDLHAATSASAFVTVIDRAKTTIALTSRTPQLVTVGESYRIAMQVTGGAELPTGMVQADAGNAGRCTAALVDGRAICDLTPALSPGLHRLAVAYAGDARHLPSIDDTLEVPVQGESDLRMSIDNHDERIGATTTYDVVMENAGPDPAFGAAMAAHTDAALLDDGDWACVGDRGVPCPPNDAWQATHTLPAGAAVHYRLTLRLAPGDAPVTTSALALPAIEGTDPEPGNNADSDGPDARAAFRDGFED
jgi:hypothetical protein